VETREKDKQAVLQDKNCVNNNSNNNNNIIARMPICNIISLHTHLSARQRLAACPGFGQPAKRPSHGRWPTARMSYKITTIKI